MRKPISQCLIMIAVILGILSCNDKNDDFDGKGSCSILLLDGPENAYMGDSISFDFQISGSGIQLNQSKVQLLFKESVVSERIVLTPQSGSYSGKILIPFMKETPDGEVTVKLRIQNERFSNAVAEKSIQIARPEFEYLTLKDVDGNSFRMLPVSGKAHTYAVIGSFPTELYAVIEAPKYRENGNQMIFGSVDGKISNGVTEFINFSADTDEAYEVTFNTLTYEGTPFVKFAMNDIEFDRVDDTRFKVETTFTQGQEIQITGLKSDYDNYWINPAFFDVVKDTNGRILRFRGRDGKYRLTVDKSLKYFRVEVMSGNALANLGNGDDVIWVIGDNNIGQPSFTTNGINWSTEEKVICLTPVGNGKHQMVLQTGKSVKKDNINFKFFYQRGWGGEFTADKISLGDESTWFRINSSDGNIRGGSTPLAEDKYYLITVDMSEGATKSKMYVEEKDSFPEVSLPVE